MASRAPRADQCHTGTTSADATLGSGLVVTLEGITPAEAGTYPARSIFACNVCAATVSFTLSAST